MHLPSSCFANLKLLHFCRSRWRCRRRCLSYQLLVKSYDLSTLIVYVNTYANLFASCVQRQQAWQAFKPTPLYRTFWHEKRFFWVGDFISGRTEVFVRRLQPNPLASHRLSLVRFFAPPWTWFHFICANPLYSRFWLFFSQWQLFHDQGNIWVSNLSFTKVFRKNFDCVFNKHNRDFKIWDATTSRTRWLIKDWN